MMLETVFLRSSRFILGASRGLGEGGWTRRQLKGPKSFNFDDDVPVFGFAVVGFEAGIRRL